MPRKQRFKPSRKPKAVGTLTDLVPLDGAAQSVVPIDPARSQDTMPVDAEAIHRSTDAPPPAVDLTGESG